MPGTLARGSLHHRAAVEMGERLYDDKGYSSVDCLSFVIMEKHDIKEALTVDGDFTHRFIARPGPAPKKSAI